MLFVCFWTWCLGFKSRNEEIRTHASRGPHCTTYFKWTPQYVRNYDGVATAGIHDHSTIPRRWEEGSGGREGALWEDPDFPADISSIGSRRLPPDLLWMRPHELSARPRFLGDTTLEGSATPAPSSRLAAQSTDDHAPDKQTDNETDEDFAARWSIDVGEVGDSNLCCAAAALALTPRLLARAAPPHSFRQGYTGAFRFQFWVWGSWRWVTVDDRLPTRRGRLITSRSALPHDYTLPLLEKAYAKLYGSYMSLREGSCARALQDLCGGVVQSFAPPRQSPALLLRVLNSAVPRATLLVLTPQQEKGISGSRMRNGLIPGQPYCVTGLARVRGEAGLARSVAGEGVEGEECAGALVRLRAPAGRGEWRGAWARGGPQWRALPAADRDLLAETAAQPGHFWMPFSELARAFGTLELVHLGPDEWVREPALRGRRAWRAALARRRWRAGCSAGGPPGARTAPANPQFRVLVPPPAAAHLVLAVAQQYEPRRAARLPPVGFALFELTADAAARRAALSAGCAQRLLEAGHVGRAREVAAFVLLAPGHYLLVPHAGRPHAEGAFLLRVLCDRRADVWEVNDDNIIIRDFNTESRDDTPIPPQVENTISKIVEKQGSDEMDVWGVRGAVRRWWPRWCGSLEVCRALVALRDAAAGGRVPAGEVPALLRLVGLWRAAVVRYARCGRGVSSYRLRALLWAAGVSASNKVLECLVLRFARRATLTPEACLLALARLHLAHERYRTLDAKLKSNPLSLEEVILMTIYS
ncbi:calpain-9-like [Papilio machaon]|uniref:calpain-9-like n=1 Tax=Papilio machaon TaxID=76193 RepID=UPI001E664ADE|nr:calpain-9-like [Papilio machaon]